jgi:hypothetical protein
MTSIAVKPKKKKLSAFDLVVNTILIFITLPCLYPPYYTVIASVSSFTAVATGKVSFWPIDFQLKAYKAVFENDQIWLGYRNTIGYTVAGTIFNLILTIPTAYVMSKKKMFGHTVFTWYFLITMYFGGGMIPTYLLYKDLGLLNNPLVMASLYMREGLSKKFLPPHGHGPRLWAGRRPNTPLTRAQPPQPLSGTPSASGQSVPPAHLLPPARTPPNTPRPTVPRHTGCTPRGGSQIPTADL